MFFSLKFHLLSKVLSSEDAERTLSFYKAQNPKEYSSSKFYQLAQATLLATDEQDICFSSQL